MIYKEGSRNDTLFRVACAMFGRSESYETVLKEITKENTWCKDESGRVAPLPDKEIRTIVDSACRQESKSREERRRVYNMGLCTLCRKRPLAIGSDWCSACARDETEEAAAFMRACVAKYDR